MEKMEKFEDMPIDEMLISSLKKRDFVVPTDVQVAAIPPALQGNDMIVQARTGSGKTLSFLIPIFEKMEGNAGIEAIVLVPVRELAQQVENEAKHIGNAKGLGTVAVYGGASIENQIRGIKKASIVVGTPGRIIDLMKRGALRLDSIKFFVLDEADRMLDMGFLEDITWIISRTPDKKQVMLYSATIPEEIVKLSRRYLDNPVRLKLSEDSISAKGISQYYVRVGDMNKLAKLSALLDNEPGKYLVFTRTKIGAQRVADNLKKWGYKAFALHGDMTQAARTRTMNDFKDGKINILIATDVASRGIDVEGISHVVNYDAPLFQKDYVHRIGRTGRLGKDGKAVTFITREELPVLRKIEEYTGKKIPQMTIEKHGKVRERIDYREYADVFGMVTLRFRVDEKTSKRDIIKIMEQQGIRDEEIGRIALGKGYGEIEIHYSRAHRASKAKLKSVSIVRKE